jgi:eukaryotic-like serine/threonine-protein kinase
MNKSHTYFIVALIFTAIFTNSCKKTFSDDSPLAKTYTPSVLVATANNTLYSLNAETGLKNWEYKPLNINQKIAEYAPLVAFDSLAFFSIEDSLVALNAKTGLVKWTKNYKGRIEVMPLYHDNKIYVLVKNNTSDSILQLDKDGNVGWRNAITCPLSQNIAHAPIIANKLLYISGSNDNKIYCFDPAGANFNAPVWTYNAGSLAKSNMAYADSFLYAAIGGNKLVKINAYTGTPIWPYNSTSTINSAPIVYGDMVIVGCDDFKVYCIDAKSGKTNSRWIYTTADRIQQSACVNTASNNIMIGSNDFNLYAINHVNGQLSWKYPTGSIVKNSPVDYNNTIMFTSLDKYCYCVNANTGKLVWKYNLNSTSLASPIVCTFSGSNFFPAESGNSKY